MVSSKRILDISILIVSHNSSPLLDRCLASIQARTRCAYEVIVVDNASTDDTVQRVRDGYPSVSLIQNQENIGFAAATNQASQTACGRYLFLLNPDSLILDDAIDALVAFMDSHPDVGVCAPRNLDGRGEIKHNCQRISTPRSYILGALIAPFVGYLRPLVRRVRPSRRYDLTGSTPLDVSVVHGNSLCIRRDLYQALNGLDDAFFMYIEDVDLCLRAGQLGWRVVYVPWAQVIHYGGCSSAGQMLPRLSNMIGDYVVRSRYHYVRKNFGRVAFWLLRFAYGLAGLGWMGAGLLAVDPDQRREKSAIGRLLLMTHPTRQPRQGRDRS